MNQFDFVITIALGSLIATILLNSSVSLIEGFIAIFLLIFLQFIVTWISVRSSSADHLIKAEPKIIFYKGNFLDKSMKKERITTSEIYEAMRNNGVNNIEDVYEVIIETNGSLSVITYPGEGKTPPTVNINQGKGHNHKYR